VTLSLFRRFPQRRGAAAAAGCALPSGIDNQRQPKCRILTFPPVSALLDEDARLCSLSVFDAFRLLQDLVTVPPTSAKRCSSAACSPMTWSPALKICRRCRAPPARTTASIWRKPAGDRPSDQNTRIQASLFTPLESEKQRLEQRIAQLRQQLNEPPAPLPVTTLPK
jgi:anthranilate synthase component 1